MRRWPAHNVAADLDAQVEAACILRGPGHEKVGLGRAQFHLNRNPGRQLGWLDRDLKEVRLEWVDVLTNRIAMLGLASPVPAGPRLPQIHDGGAQAVAAARRSAQFT